MKIFNAIRRLFIEYGRVLKVTKKPTTKEFKTIVKVTGLGIIAIGFVGFVIQMIKVLLVG